MDGQQISAAWKVFQTANPGLFETPASGMYLSNRIEAAFIAGCDAAKGAARVERSPVDLTPALLEDCDRYRHKIHVMADVLKRIKAWDALNPPTDDGSDARFWRGEIDAALSFVPPEGAPKMDVPQWPTLEDFKRLEAHANAVSVLHGKAWDVARELFDMVKNGERLAPKGIETYEKLIYGEPRQVPPHRSGGGQLIEPSEVDRPAKPLNPLLYNEDGTRKPPPGPPDPPKPPWHDPKG